ncbi:MAG: C40 family peptidase [Aeriscardovia sp.]|nr:C40 family peptidase [Aeriscardovia sp.]
MSVRDLIVEYAKNAIGCEYDDRASGGDEGISYNCSYLTTCAYRHAGLDIPYWQGHQNGSGSQSDLVYWNGHWTTNPENLKPGDLVFFGKSRFNTGHVGISLGGYQMIDSIPNGGVDIRDLYWNFVGGGWPLSTLPEDMPQPEPEPEQLEIPMDCIISVPERNVCAAILGGQIHDLTEPDNIVILNKVYAATHNGADMPWIEISPDWYARLVQAYSAGLPKLMGEYNTKFPPRS